LMHDLQKRIHCHLRYEKPVKTNEKHINANTIYSLMGPFAKKT
jgi:hypothetical protein